VLLYALTNLPVAIAQVVLITPPEPGEPQSGLSVLLSVVGLVLGLLAVLAIPNLIERSICGRRLGVGAALQSACPKLLVTLLVTLAFVLIVALGILAFIIPGIWFGNLLGFYAFAIAIRNCGFNALTYSRSLVAGRWWSVFGRSVFINFIFGIVGLLAGAIFGFAILAAGITTPTGKVLQVLYGSIVAFTNYYVIVVYTLMFLNFDYTRDPSASPSRAVLRES